jgi:hypothetical protein
MCENAPGIIGAFPGSGLFWRHLLFEPSLLCQLGAQPRVMVLDLAKLLHDPIPDRGVRPAEATTCLPQDGACDRRLAAEVCD